MAEKKSLIDLVIGPRQGKKEWRAYVKRRDALPEAYRIVMKAIEKFMYMVGIDASVMTVFYAIIDLFEEGAAEGRAVLDITGEDVADFAYSIFQAVQAETWTGIQGRKLNHNVHEQLARLAQKGA